MLNNVFTEKQTLLISLLKYEKLKRINILEGSVSSGKTWISLVLWAFWVAGRPKNQLFLMSAKTLNSLKRNCLLPLQGLVGKKNFTFSLSAKEGMLFGHKILLEGANDARSEEKIRGLTLGGAYCDELTLFPKDFFSMLLSRLRVEGAKVIGTTNPDRPTHWLHKEYIMKQNELDMLVMKFLIDDNTFLPEDYVENLKKEYSGVYAERFIKGRWVVAEDSIYREFCDNKADFIIDDINPSDIMYANIGVDFGGNKSAHAFVCTGYTRGLSEVVTLEEYYKKGENVSSPKQLEDDFIEFAKYCKSKYRVHDAYCDSAEQLLIKGLRRAAIREKLGIHIHNARKGRTNERIQFFSRIMGVRRYKILRHCKNVIGAIEDAVWADNSTEDIRLDDGSSNIDSLDALEYGVEPQMSDILKKE